MSITIDKEFEALIPPLTSEEFQQLEENCVKEGIRDALITWNGVLIDGHNRFKIAAKHGLMWNEKRMEFADRDEAKVWIINKQLGQRNLSKYDKVTLEDQKREILAEQAQSKILAGKADPPKKSWEGTERQRHRENETDYKIAKSAGTSEDTVRKVRKINELATPEIKQQVREGKLSINQAYNSVHPKRLDPVKQAKQEHEAFQEKKRDTVVNFNDVQIDQINQRIIDNDLYQTILKMVGNVESFGLLHKRSELEKLFDGMDKDAINNLRDRCEMCKSIFQLIMEATLKR